MCFLSCNIQKNPMQMKFMKFSTSGLVHCRHKTPSFLQYRFLAGSLFSKSIFQMMFMSSSLGMCCSLQTQVYNEHHFIPFRTTWFRSQAHIPPDWKQILHQYWDSLPSQGKGNIPSLMIGDTHIAQAIPWGPDTSVSVLVQFPETCERLDSLEPRATPA